VIVFHTEPKVKQFFQRALPVEFSGFQFFGIENNLKGKPV